MSSPLFPTKLPGVTRRGLLGMVTGAGALMAGCTKDLPGGQSGQLRPKKDPNPEQDPDVALAARAVAVEQSVADAVLATIDNHTDLAAVLSPVLAAHRAHVRLLDDAAPEKVRSASPSPTTGPSTGLGEFRVPARAPVALRRLAALEQELSLTNRRHAFAAQSGAFARMLASIAASAAQQAAVLRESTGTEGSGR